MRKPAKERTLKRLRKSLTEIDDLWTKDEDSYEFQRWIRGARTAISNAFGDQSRHLSDFNSIDYTTPIGYWDDLGDRFEHTDDPFKKGLGLATAILESMVDEVEEYWEEVHLPEDALNRSETKPNAAAINSNEIFIIHGRDDGSKNSVARFLESLDLVPTILSELPAQGQTIIEKFESQSGVEFAVALLTSDDKGSLRDEERNNLRARQNVVFELGFFIGKLGRGRVCALTKGDLEIPSDYAGVEYIPLDDLGAWKMELFKELREAGFNIDADRLVGA